MELLIKKGVDINSVEFMSWTALALAAVNGEKRTVEIVLSMPFFHHVLHR